MVRQRSEDGDEGTLRMKEESQQIAGEESKSPGCSRGGKVVQVEKFPPKLPVHRFSNVFFRVQRTLERRPEGPEEGRETELKPKYYKSEFGKKDF